MREFIEYVGILIDVDTDFDELENHLSMNGYNFGLDRRKNLLFVYIEEVDYVETILEDRNILYSEVVY